MRSSVTPSSSTLLLVAHGTRCPAGPEVIEALSAAVSSRLDVPVRAAYVDVIGPTVAEALASIEGPVVALPAFLAAGYHVRTDLPEQLAATGRHSEVLVVPPLGPSRPLAEAMLGRLTEAGWRPGDRVLFSAAGSSDPRALGDVRTAAQLLGELCEQRLAPSFVSTADPLTGDLCTDERNVFIAPYLLAPGLFHQRLTDFDVIGVADPIGAHPFVVELIVNRYRQVRRECAPAA
ncbi:sirohydrochlorin chelatase [Parasphingorhabdus pacifica]